MKYAQVIIVGAGPAGSTCAWKLRQNNLDVLILDKQPFPRAKLCAGWIQPQVLADLQVDINAYPHSLTRFDDLYLHIGRKTLKLPGRQYAIRRTEFDHWLLQRSGVEPIHHEVKDIQTIGAEYVLDQQYRCHYLVGAGGSQCPVYHHLFRPDRPRAQSALVVTLEEEFRYEFTDDRCQLWFFHHQLPGYAWYVPKRQGYLNIGIGGYAEKLKTNQDSIRQHWQWFIAELQRLDLVKNHAFNARGYGYYIRTGTHSAQMERVYLIGDAAGLATKDMGEGIGPAIQSGILAAQAIVLNKPYSIRTIKKDSFPRLPTVIKVLFAMLKR